MNNKLHNLGKDHDYRVIRHHRKRCHTHARAKSSRAEVGRRARDDEDNSDSSAGRYRRIEGGVVTDL